MYLLSKNAKVTRVANGAAAGTGTTNGTGLDMKDFDAVTFVALIGAVTATGVVTLKAQQSDDDGAADAYSDLEGTAVAYTDAEAIAHCASFCASLGSWLCLPVHLRH